MSSLPYLQALQHALEHVPDNLIRDGQIYVAPLHPPVQIPISACVTDGPALLQEAGTFITLQIDQEMADFFVAAEDAILETSLPLREKWFAKGVSEEDLRAGFKRFADGAERIVSVKLDNDVALFEEDIEELQQTCGPLRIKAILELGRVSFGKSEWGGLWRLRRFKVLAASQQQQEEDFCLVDGDGSEIAASIL